MRTLCALPLAAACLLTPQLARAQSWCTGVPNAILTQSDGLVIVDVPWRHSWVGICNIRSNWKGIDTNVCWNWFSQITAAIADEKPTVIYYSATLDCAAVPTYDSSPAPYYVSMRRQ